MISENINAQAESATSVPRGLRGLSYSADARFAVAVPDVALVPPTLVATDSRRVEAALEPADSCTDEERAD